MRSITLPAPRRLVRAGFADRAVLVAVLVSLSAVCSAEARRIKMESVDRFTMASLGDWDWRESLRDLSAPTLVIHGTADFIPTDAAREWAATLPNARLLLMDGVGHFPYLEAPNRFFPAVREFAAGGWPEAAAQPEESL